MLSSTEWLPHHLQAFEPLRNLWGLWTPETGEALHLVLNGQPETPLAPGNWHGGITLSTKPAIRLQQGVKSHQTGICEICHAVTRHLNQGHTPLPLSEPGHIAQPLADTPLQAEFKNALTHNELRVFYQPVVNMNADIVGAEALVRWQHPTKGLVSPAHFIGMAEETGLIIPMGWWVLRTACQQLAQWAQVPYKATWTIAVNVSAKQFLQDNFVDEVQRILDESGINPRRLKLELTESVMVQQVENAISKMTVLQAQGIKFSLDDFGTGYSSLSYLKRLPLQQLKIDQSFVRDIHKDANDEAIVKTILALAQSLELSVVAEGVETPEQEEFLIAAGCRQMQGYLYGRPMPVDQWP